MTDYENQTEVSEDEPFIDNDSEDEDLTFEDKELRREILKTFMANSKMTKSKTGKFTNMRMTLPEEEYQKARPISRPVETEHSYSVASRFDSRNETLENETKRTEKNLRN